MLGFFALKKPKNKSNLENSALVVDFYWSGSVFLYKICTKDCYNPLLNGHSLQGDSKVGSRY
jgi:hypothetical protein